LKDNDFLFGDLQGKNKEKKKDTSFHTNAQAKTKQIKKTTSYTQGPSSSVDALNRCSVNRVA
jgi:hypothetical protein